MWHIMYSDVTAFFHYLFSFPELASKPYTTSTQDRSKTEIYTGKMTITWVTPSFALTPFVIIVDQTLDLSTKGGM